MAKAGLAKRADCGNMATRWGNANEEVACRLYEEKTGNYVYHFGVIQHPR